MNCENYEKIENNKIDLLSLNKSEICDIFSIRIGAEKYRAEQLFSWIYRAKSFDEMSNIPEKLRAKLKECFYISNLEIEKKLISNDGTVKYLFKLFDGNKIESVFMKYNHGNSACLSTQVGCKMNCAFCASGISEFKRNLSAGEILAQILAIQRDLNEKIGYIVLMGIGEPLDNYENVMKFLELVNNKECLNISFRKISLSTCGLVDKIKQLKINNLAITLSVSLHAPNDFLRNQIMPINNKYNINELLIECENYANYTKRRISFEYILIDNFNCEKEHARELAIKLKSNLKSMLFHVNLIAVNSARDNNFKPPSKKKIEIFKHELEKAGINTTIRRTLGGDVKASCGQLRSETEKEIKKNN